MEGIAGEKGNSPTNDCLRKGVLTERIALHTRNYKKNGLTTLLEHHRKIAEQSGWDPDCYLVKAGKIRPNTRLLFEKIMENKFTSPERGLD